MNGWQPRDWLLTYDQLAESAKVGDAGQLVVGKPIRFLVAPQLKIVFGRIECGTTRHA